MKNVDRDVTKRNRVLLAAVFVLALFPAAAFAGSTAVAIVSNAGGVGETSVQTAREILKSELRARGVEIVDSPDLQAVQEPDAKARTIAAGLGAGSMYVLQFAPLGNKLYVAVQQLDLEGKVVASRHLQAKNVEELDVVIPRLVRALATAQSVEGTAKIDTVTAKEGDAWEKRPGESAWGLGILGAIGGGRSTGGDLRFMFEMEHYRLNATIGWISADDDDGVDVFRMGAGASYLFLSGDISPYVGADAAYLTIDTPDGSGTGLGVIPHVGVELFRLHRARLLLEAGVMLPLYSLDSGTRSGSGPYEAVGYGTVAVAW